MRAPLRTYTAYSLGSVVAWLVALALAARTGDENKQRSIRLTCAGWWLGWLSATIARRVYPPPRRWRPSTPKG